MKFTNGGMEHTPAQTMVFQTDQYSKFNLIKGNRGIDQNKIKKILADIERGTNLLPFVPILVVENKGKLEIVDGQHRFMVARKIKHQVHYVVCTTQSLYDIARMNSNTEKWKAKDFINCYVELGNKNYIKLQKLLTDFPGLTITVAILLLATGKTGHNDSVVSSFQQGGFIVKFEKETYEVCERAKEFKYDRRFTAAFLAALVRIIDANLISVLDLTEKVNRSPEELRYQSNHKKYLSNLQEIYNKGKHKQVLIY
jgi:hypothetical protein